MSRHKGGRGLGRPCGRALQPEPQRHRYRGSGVCFGDSGSPQFDRGTLLVLSVTSWGNGQCNANNQNYRVDTPLARAFLGQFLTLP